MVAVPDESLQIEMTKGSQGWWYLAAKVWRSDLWESAEERFLKESCKKHWIRMKQEQEAFNSQLN